MGIKEIKKELNNLAKKELIDIIAGLYKSHKRVKEYLDFYVNPDEEAFYEEYREKILEAFYPKRGKGYNLKTAKNAIADFKKLGTSKDLVADLLLFYVETGISFTREFGDINESFYISMAKTYEQALKLLKNENILNNFAGRATAILKNSEGTGWGLYEDISDIHCIYYPDHYNAPDEPMPTNNRASMRINRD
ncbi:MAG: DUF6155 family protein [Candidatus Cyclobacteriaceae bacterium M2_1C_046]